MAAPQQILALSVANLVSGLVNPPCVDASGQASATQPSGPLEACPAGAHRVASPVLDMHVGVISAALGDAGTGVCAAAVGTTEQCPAGSPANPTDDHAHLLTRADGCGSTTVPTSSARVSWRGMPRRR